MRNFSTPGVFVEEITTFPPSVAPVATAIPAFIGYTEKTQTAAGATLVGVSRRITSLLEYEALYGRTAPEALSVVVRKRVGANGALIGVNVSFATPPPPVPTSLMYYAMQHYFANGGGPCYIHSIGGVGGSVSQGDFTGAITALEAVDEVTLLVFPDATRLAQNAHHGNVVVAALNSCVATQDRFTIADVRNARAGQTETAQNVTDNFRAQVGASSVDLLKYGAAYFPYLNTSIPRITSDARVTVAAASTVVTVADDGSEITAPLFPNSATPPAGTDVTLASARLQGDASASPLVPGETAVVNAIRAFLSSAYVTLPPSAAMAGVYARVDRTRGVHKAPANVGVFNVIEPAVPITDDLNGALNVDPTAGKSVNVIRNFTGKGALVWGARTLAGNDQENRYVPVRRFLNFAEESIEKAIGAFVFEPNDANTWMRVRTMIENFLLNQWRGGALVGAKPEQAFDVKVGLNQTMTADDILNGLMIVRIGVAIVRPAEFIVLEFQQLQQQG